MISHAQQGAPGLLIFPKYGPKTGIRSEVRTEIGPDFHNIVSSGLNDGITDRRDRVVFHTLRHTYASWLVQAGGPLYTMQKLMGHKTITMTQRYAHLAPDQGAEAARVLSGVVLS